MTDPALPIATAFIAAREAFVATPYRDIGGVYTIGFGFTFTPDMRRVSADTPPITHDAAYARLQDMVADVLTKVRAMVYVPLSDNAASALASFAFNEGTHALRTSTLLDRLNAREPLAIVAECFAGWVYAGGRYSQGLANRRKMEAALFLDPDGVAATKSENPPSLSTADDLNQAELNRIHQE